MKKCWIALGLLLSLQAYSYNYRPLDILANKQLVAIGESGHGVAAFHQIRSEIVQRFVQRFGFRIIVIESNALESLDLNAALSSCSKGAIDWSKLNQQFKQLDTRTYRHQEFYQMFQFLCRWNATHPSDMVHLVGMDIWTPTWEIRKILETLIASVTTVDLKKLVATAAEQCFLWSLEKLDDYPLHADWVYFEKYSRVDPERHKQCLSSLGSLRDQVLMHAQKLQKELSPKDFLKLQIALDVGLSNQNLRDVYYANFSQAMSLRDATQARNTLKLLQYLSKGKSLYLAHNLHVFQRMSTVLPGDIDTDFAWSHVTSSGEWLKAHYGNNMAVIGLGGYDLTSLSDGAYPRPKDSRSIDYQLHQKGHAFYILNAQRKPWSKGFWWVHNETDSKGLWISPKEQFDFYIFINQSPAAQIVKE